MVWHLKTKNIFFHQKHNFGDSSNYYVQTLSFSSTMDSNNIMRLFMLFVLQFMSLQIIQVRAFKCHACSYAYSKDNPSADTACINLPYVYTQLLDCKDYCIVQEIYNKVLQKVVAYWRSCTDKPDTNYCIGDRLLTCVHTCQGDFCNSWVRGQLHNLYEVNSASTISKTRSSHVIAVASCVIGLIKCIMR